VKNYLEKYRAAGDINELEFLDGDRYLTVQVSAHLGWLVLTCC
jgi:hypothetical protein